MQINPTLGAYAPHCVHPQAQPRTPWFMVLKQYYLLRLNSHPFTFLYGARYLMKSIEWLDLPNLIYLMRKSNRPLTTSCSTKISLSIISIGRSIHTIFKKVTWSLKRTWIFRLTKKRKETLSPHGLVLMWSQHLLAQEPINYLHLKVKS